MGVGDGVDGGVLGGVVVKEGVVCGVAETEGVA